MTEMDTVMKSILEHGTVSGAAENGGFAVPGKEGERYEICPDGVYRVVPQYKGKKEIDPDRQLICGYLIVTAVTRDRDGGDCGRMLAFKDFEGRDRTLTVSDDLIGSGGTELTKLLMLRGFQIYQFNARGGGLSPVNAYLNAFPREGLRREITVDRGGWSDDSFTCFVLEGQEIHAAGCKAVSKLSPRAEGVKIESRGTLADWQRLNAEICRHSSRVSFAVAVALAAPVLQIVGGMNRTFNFCGGSGLGKSSALCAAASVWGNADYIQSMKGTGNGAEAFLQRYNNLPCIFDEMSDANAAMLEAMTYTNGNGRGKLRMNKDGKAKEAKPWSNFSLSSGEAGLDEMKKLRLKGAAAQLSAGEVVRCLDIPIETNSPNGHGAFESFPEGCSDKDQRDAFIRERTSDFAAYGTAGAAFLQKLTEDISECGLDAFRARARERIDAFESVCARKKIESQALRALHAFSVVAFVGELATDYGVLMWQPGDAVKAARACFEAWQSEAHTLDRRGKDFAESVRGDVSTRRQNYHRYKIDDETTCSPAESVGTLGAVGTLILDVENRAVVSFYTGRQFSRLVRDIGDGLKNEEAKKALLDSSMILAAGNEKGYSGFCKLQQEHLPYGLSKGRFIIIKQGEQADEVVAKVKKQ